MAAAMAVVFFTSPPGTAPWSAMLTTRSGNTGRRSCGMGKGALIGAMGSAGS